MPAVAVIQGGQVLSGSIGCKGCVGCYRDAYIEITLEIVLTVYRQYSLRWIWDSGMVKVPMKWVDLNWNNSGEGDYLSPF